MIAMRRARAHADGPESPCSSKIFESPEEIAVLDAKGDEVLAVIREVV
jgi:hypothetical protein